MVFDSLSRGLTPCPTFSTGSARSSTVSSRLSNGLSSISPNPSTTRLRFPQRLTFPKAKLNSLPRTLSSVNNSSSCTVKSENRALRNRIASGSSFSPVAFNSGKIRSSSSNPKPYCAGIAKTFGCFGNSNRVTMAVVPGCLPKRSA